MSDLMSMLTQQIGGEVIGQMSKQLGTDSTATQQAVTAALPMLLGALSRNASTPQGAEALSKALSRDHDGAILNDLLGAVTNPQKLQDGNKIVGHVLGDKRSAVEQGLSQATGLKADNSAQLLAMLAPVVMGALGQTQRQGGLDAASLANLLGGQRSSFDSSMGGLAGFLDMNGDGSVVDDVVNLGSKLLGGLFGPKA